MATFALQPFFLEHRENTKNVDYKNLYTNWVTDLNQNESIFDLNDQGQPAEVKSSKKLVEQIEDLAQNMLPFISFSEKANKVNLIAT